ncbi:MAG: hypothetical protein U1F24_13250 [Alphaproteobacteria bacterium]
MTLSAAIQMDPIHAIDIGGDSTFALALEAQNRGHTPSLRAEELLPTTAGCSLRAATISSVHEKGTTTRSSLKRWSNSPTWTWCCCARTSPYDMAYLTTTYVLQRIHPKTLVVNDPVHVRDAPEKLFPVLWPDLIPPTLVTDRADPRLPGRTWRRHRQAALRQWRGGVFASAPATKISARCSKPSRRFRASR